MPRPKAHHKANGEIRADAPFHHSKKPDLDNLIKATLDAMTQAGAWRDDSQVSTIRASKQYAFRLNKTGVRILI